MSKMNLRQYQQHVHNQHAGRMFTQPTRLKNDQGEVIYDNTGLWDPKVHGRNPSVGNYECPQCQKRLSMKEDGPTKTMSIICGQCRSYWSLDELKAYRKKQLKNV